MKRRRANFWVTVLAFILILVALNSGRDSYQPVPATDPNVLINPNIPQHDGNVYVGSSLSVEEFVADLPSGALVYGNDRYEIRCRGFTRSRSGRYIPCRGPLPGNPNYREYRLAPPANTNAYEAGKFLHGMFRGTGEIVSRSIDSMSGVKAGFQKAVEEERYQQSQPLPETYPNTIVPAVEGTFRNAEETEEDEYQQLQPKSRRPPPDTIPA